MPKYIGERKLERVGHGTVFRSPSESRPGLFHLTVYSDDGGGARCSCEGFCMHGHCWHVDAIPLCLAEAEYPAGAKTGMCRFVKDHGGDHSWGPDRWISEGEAVSEGPKTESFDPLKGLPQ